LGSSPIPPWTSGGEHDVGAAAAGERLPDDLFRLALRVDVRGVDEVDARVQGAVDDPHRVVVVGVAPGAEHHRPEAERADLDSGAAERSGLHAANARHVRRPWVARPPVGPPASPGRPTGETRAVITAFVLIHVDAASIASAAQAVADLPAVSEVWSCAGDVDLIAVVRVAAHEDLADVVTGGVAAVAGVQSTTTHIAFRSYSGRDLETGFDIGT